MPDVIRAIYPRALAALRLIITLFILIVSAVAAHAQKEQNIWYCSSGIVIDFSSGAPVVVPAGSPALTPEGTASICDGATGRMLFFTDGLTVWDNRQEPMPNGSGLLGDPSSTQCALIVPMPSDPQRYYIFTVGSFEGHDNGLNYSIVDMSRRAGLGDVTTRNVSLLSSSSEKLTAVRHCNGNDFWVIAHARDGSELYAYLVTSTGVSTRPVISRIGDGGTVWTIGYLKASPDGRRLAAANFFESAVWLLDFDPATGVISRPIRFETGANTYGVGFSPDNSKLYFTGIGRGFSATTLYQCSIVPDDSASIVASKFAIQGSENLNFGTLQLGPDGRLYIPIAGSSSIAIIGNPNIAGAGCGFMADALDVQPRSCGFGLPNVIDCLVAGCTAADAVFDLDAASICRGSSIGVINRSVGSVKTWEFPGGTPSTSTAADPGRIVYAASGSYTIRLIVTDGRGGLDTAEKSVTVTTPPAVELGPDRTTCSGECIDLVPAVTGGAPPYSFAWTPAPGLSCLDCANPRACPTATTMYHLVVTDANGCQGSDSIMVTMTDPVTAHIIVPRGLAVAPGAVADIPVVLTDPVDLSHITSLDITLHYNPSVMHLRGEEKPGSRTSGTLLDGWTSLVLADDPGLLTMRLLPPAGVPTTPVTGDLLHLRFATYLSAGNDSMPALSSTLTLEVGGETGCVNPVADAGELRLAICGLSYRVIEMTGAKYAIDAITPNPAGHVAEIGFTLGLDGPTRVEIFDADGRRAAALLDEHLQSGAYTLRWDATEVPSGLYYCRISSGDWTATRSMMIAR